VDLQTIEPAEEPLLRHLPYFEPSTTTIHRNSVKASVITVPVIEGTESFSAVLAGS
jgi:hypothetical protein